jgi:hypothetical protein
MRHAVIRSCCALLVLLLTTLSIAACNRGHSAKWYMAHGDAMRAKVQQCKADPQRAAGDKDCDNAIEAFVTWARATGQK